jgi:hypothetical protein
MQYSIKLRRQRHRRLRHRFAHQILLLAVLGMTGALLPSRAEFRRARRGPRARGPRLLEVAASRSRWSPARSFGGGFAMGLFTD